MKKPYWLKKIFIKYYITNFFFFFITLFIKPKGDKNKILITEFDGIGDIIVNQKLIDLIIKKYGRENVIFLVRNNTAELIDLLIYKYETYEDECHMKITKLFKVYRKLCRYNFKELYFLEFHQRYDVNELKHSDKENKINFLKKFKFDKVYGYKNGMYESWNKKFHTVLVDPEYDRIIDKVFNYAREIEGGIKKEDLVPELPIKTSEKAYITVGVGTTDSSRMCSPKKLAEFLKYLVNLDKNIKIHLLGHGKRDENYSKKLIEILGKDNLISYVSKLNLGESTKMIADSKLYIGFDSGLYNIAYGLRKKTIGIFLEELKSFQHNAEYVKIVVKENDENETEVYDEYYNNKLMNEISLNSFIKAYYYFYPEK